MVGYKIADANSYVVITGQGIHDVKISKKAFVRPFQKSAFISVSPFDFSINLRAMTIEKLQFSLPAVFTIGPNTDPSALKKYAMLLTGNARDATTDRAKTVDQTKASGRTHVQEIVKGIIEGETRVIVSTMTMEEIFQSRQIFKTKIIENVQQELSQFGLTIYNANIKELEDTPGSEYFTFLSRKAHEGASNKAKIDVANARMLGDIGKAEKEGLTRQELSKIDAQTAVLETKRKSEKAQADAELATTQTRLNNEVKLAQIAADRAAESKDAELEKEVALKRAMMELEKKRAKDVVSAKIAREAAEQTADARLYTDTKTADAENYKAKKQAESTAYASQQKTDYEFYQSEKQANGKYITLTKATDADAYKLTKTADANRLATTTSAEAAATSKTKAAEADLFEAQRKAEARAYEIQTETEANCSQIVKIAEANSVAKQREAEGIKALADAYGHMATVFGGPQGLIQYLMLQDNTFEKLALANAKAINNLQPKINVWTTGSSDGSANGADAMSPIRNLMQTLPPLMGTIQDQTGMTPPGWMLGMPGKTAAAENEHMQVAPYNKANGKTAAK